VGETFFVERIGSCWWGFVLRSGVARVTGSSRRLTDHWEKVTCFPFYCRSPSPSLTTNARFVSLRGIEDLSFSSTGPALLRRAGGDVFKAVFVRCVGCEWRFEPPPTIGNFVEKFFKNFVASPSRPFAFPPLPWMTFAFSVVYRRAPRKQGLSDTLFRVLLLHRPYSFSCPFLGNLPGFAPN